MCNMLHESVVGLDKKGCNILNEHGIPIRKKYCIRIIIKTKLTYILIITWILDIKHYDKHQTDLHLGYYLNIRYSICIDDMSWRLDRKMLKPVLLIWKICEITCRLGQRLLINYILIGIFWLIGFFNTLVILMLIL